MDENFAKTVIHHKKNTVSYVLRNCKKTNRYVFSLELYFLKFYFLRNCEKLNLEFGGLKRMMRFPWYHFHDGTFVLLFSPSPLRDNLQKFKKELCSNICFDFGTEFQNMMIKGYNTNFLFTEYLILARSWIPMSVFKSLCFDLNHD